MANPIVDTLPKYVDESHDELISKSVLGGKSAGMFNLMVNVNKPTALHNLTTDVVFQDGSDCGFNAEGDSEISQRVMTPAIIKVNSDFCPKKLLGTYASHKVKVAAGIKTLPYEEEFVNGIVEGVQNKIEKMIYQGDSDNTAECDGLIKILSEGGVGTIIVNEAKGTSAYQMIKDVYAAMPEETIQKDDAVILVGAGVYRAYVQEIVAANLYHYDANDGSMESYLPGTNCRIIAVNGLNDANGFDYVIGGNLSNLYYGTDVEGSDSDFELWYSEDDRVFKLAIEFAIGTQVRFPDRVVLGKRAK